MIKRIFLILILLIAVSKAEEGIKVLYFFSATCPYCKEATPYVNELSKEFSVEGILFGKEEAKGLSFPVRKGTKEMANRYGVKGVPTLIVLKDGVFKHKIIGVRDIKDARTIIKALEMGAMSVSEAVEKNPEGEFIITGWIINKEDYFEKDSKFFITDRQKEILVNTWLPLEVAKSPFKKQRPRLMSDVVDKPVVLKGRLIRTKEGGIKFHVKEEISLD